MFVCMCVCECVSPSCFLFLFVYVSVVYIALYVLNRIWENYSLCFVLFVLVSSVIAELLLLWLFLQLSPKQCDGNVSKYVFKRALDVFILNECGFY